MSVHVKLCLNNLNYNYNLHRGVIHVEHIGKESKRRSTGPPVIICGLTNFIFQPLVRD